MTATQGAPAPRVSIVLPVHNRAALLRRSVASVLAQSFGDFELIVVDDASDEDVRRALGEPADGRIVCVRRERRGGPGAARNEGIRRARADLVAFQDSDDEWLPDKLERQLRLLESSPPEVGLVCGGFYRDWGGRREYHRPSAAHVRGDFAATVLANLGYIAPTWLVRKRALLEAGLFDEALASREDWELALRLHDVCAFRALDEPLVVKHQGADGVDADLRAHLSTLQRTLERHRARFERDPAVLARHLRELGVLQALFGGGPAARTTLARAARVAPPGARALALWVATFLGPRGLGALLAVRRKLRLIMRTIVPGHPSGGGSDR